MNRAAITERYNAALPSDAAPDPDFGGPGGMARWQSTKSLAFAFAYGHRGEPDFPQPCREIGSGGTATQRPVSEMRARTIRGCAPS